MKPMHVLFWLTLWRCTNALENGCHRFPVVENAVILDSSLKTNYTDGDLIHFICRVGYLSRGEITYKCNDRRWRINRQTKCSPKQCDIPEDIVNGEYNLVNGTDFVFGTVIKYTCNEGYMLVGGSTRLCMSEGWSDLVPSCEVVKCRPVHAIGDLIACGNTKSPQYGDIIQFECRTDSMKMHGEKQIHCTDTGEWSASIPRCEVVICGPVQATGDLYAFGNTKSPQHGDIIQFECRKDYMKIKGEKQIHCTDAGEWSASIPQCEVVKCRPVWATGDLIAFGNTMSPQQGDIIQFECRNDYMKINGGKQIHCTDTGEWSASIPRCEDINADRKAVIRKAKMSEDMQRYAIDCATQAMEKFNDTGDIAEYIKQEFNKKYKPYWQCIVERGYGWSVNHTPNHYIHFYLGKYMIVLFKTD